MINRKAEIKKKGFDMNTRVGTDEIYTPTDFSKIRVGIKTLDDAIYQQVGDYFAVSPRLGDKKYILDVINKMDLEAMREISNYFYRSSGIYARLCRYMAYIYRYDWIVTPYINSSNIKSDKVLDIFYKVLNYLDNFEAKKFFSEVALKVIKNGCYYGYLIPQDDRMVVQELSSRYCRSRFSANGKPVIEFNMRYFDDTFNDTTQRNKMLNLFPAEFKKGYKLYKDNQLLPDFLGDVNGWYMLDPNYVVKFNLNEEDFPTFISVIPAIIDLNEAQALDRKKMQQQLLKIIIQKMPLDKNGDLVFDVDEAQQLHNNAVRMLSKAIGLDVLTTFADVDVADMSDSSTSVTTDELEKMERAVYNEAGVSQMQFNTDGNIALEKSILNDEAMMHTLLMQFERFFNDILKSFNKFPRKYSFKVQFLPTTIYNYKDLAKLYKEQTQIGYSKMLPQIALGQTQSAVLATLTFENDILDLVNSLIPPLMSSTMNADILNRNKDGDGEVGRKELPDDEKSEKTLLNEESIS